MTEDEAKAYIEAMAGAKAVDLVGQFLAMVSAENTQQNLIARASIDAIWARHAADSAQLIRLAADPDGRWMDIGTGGGFPGMIVGILRDGEILLVEPRRKRAAFLEFAAQTLGIQKRVMVAASPVEKVVSPSAIISARAVATTDNLLLAAHQCSTISTRWILPRGQLDPGDIEKCRESWDFMFHVEQSVTNPMSQILVLDEVRKR